MLRPTLLVLGPQVGWVVTTGTVANAVLTVMLVGVYMAGVLGLGTLVRTFPGGGGGDLVVAASTLAVAGAFGPLRRRIQDLVDRRFNRERYDTRRTVQTFAQGLRDEVDLETLRRDPAEVAGATLRPAYANVWLAVPSRSGERP